MYLTLSLGYEYTDRSCECWSGNVIIINALHYMSASILSWHQFSHYRTTRLKGVAIMVIIVTTTDYNLR